MSYAPFPRGPEASHPQFAGPPAGPSARSVTTRTVIGALLALAVLWGLVLLIAYGSLHTVTGQALDEVALAQAKADRNAYFPGAALVLAQYVPELVAVAAGGLALVWAVRYRRWTAAVCAAGAAFAANVTTQFLKHGVLDKPDLGIQQIASNSFPSGHTTAAASALMAVLLVAPPHLRARAGRWGALIAAVTGMLTILNGWHRPTDAAAALLIVGGWGVVAALVARAVDAALSRTDARPGAASARFYRQFRENRSRRRQDIEWSEDRGESAYLPPAHARAERQFAEQQRAEQERAARERGRAASYPQAQPGYPHAQYGHQQPQPAWSQPAPYGAPVHRPRFPARPRLGTAITLTVLAAALLAAAIWWPSPTVAGTLAGRVTLTAGYVGIAAAAALGWSLVARRLRAMAR